MGKAKDFLKVALVVTSIVALLNVSYVGINHSALTASTSGTEVLPEYIAAIILPQPVQEVIEVFSDGGISFEAREQRAEISIAAEQNAQSEQLSESFVVYFKAGKEKRGCSDTVPLDLG